MILEAYYEPQFSPHSHGFRPDLGCHTALSEVQHQWSGTKWFIEGDIKGCFDNINHRVLLKTLQEKIHDGRFINLIAGMLEAGYLEDWTYHKTLSGTSQGGVISPILANIYLNKLDEYVVGTLIPEYTKGNRRKTSKEYLAVWKRLKRAKDSGKVELAKSLRALLKEQPIYDYQDLNYRRLRYVRYADDFLLGFIGPKGEADEIKGKIKDWLAENLDLAMSEEKTLVTHACEGAAKFLGYEIMTFRTDQRPTINGRISLRVPKDKLKAFCDRYRTNDKPIQRNELLDYEDFSIVAQYGLEYRGIVQYYQMATNIHWMRRLHWVMWVSLLKTLARKHKSSVLAMSKQYRPSNGAKGVVEVIVQRGEKSPLRAAFGDVKLRRNRRAGLLILDPKYRVINSDRTELIQRLMHDRCELCGSQDRVQVHHLRKLADTAGKARWQQRMSAMRRKTLVVCGDCHDRIHDGRPTLEPLK
jgi:group II intron reverse transcriptase/maturase